MTQRASLLAGGEDTIVAIATPQGRGALATIRMSGARAIEIARALGAGELHPRVATRVMLQHPREGAALDDALVTAFPGPHSYTGEDVVELSTHGGLVAPQLVLSACITAGARQAYPGEFSRRAVLNGRMDLVQAEGVVELIDARTTAMHRQALHQLDGGLTRRFTMLRDEVLQLEALIAYDIDFPEEDDGPIAPARIESATRRLLDSLDLLLATAPRAQMLRNGALVVIAGPPNAGKSSLFNAMLGEARALVTPIAGTTRDAIEAVLDTPSVPLRLVDTAGLRETTDTIERMGIEVSERYLGNADAVIACAEDVDGLERTLSFVGARSTAPVLAVRTKSDLHAGEQGSTVHAGEQDTWSFVDVSAETGRGVATVIEQLQALCTAAVLSSGGDELVVTRERQRLALEEARDEVARFLLAWKEQQLPAIVAAVHLQSAAAALNALIGDVTIDDVLDRVFREFCIGK